jgi:hypothetical protein
MSTECEQTEEQERACAAVFTSALLVYWSKRWSTSGAPERRMCALVSSWPLHNCRILAAEACAFSEPVSRREITFCRMVGSKEMCFLPSSFNANLVNTWIAVSFERV